MDKKKIALIAIGFSLIALVMTITLVKNAGHSNGELNPIYSFLFSISVAVPIIVWAFGMTFYYVMVEAIPSKAHYLILFVSIFCAINDSLGVILIVR